MKHCKFGRIALATSLAVGVAATMPLVPRHAAAQSNPTMTNVVPDGGSFATKGKVEAIDPGARTVTIAPGSVAPMPMVVASGVDLGGISAGDTVSAHYSRSVTFVVGSPDVAPPPATSASVGQVAQTPGGIGTGGATITGRVVKLDGRSSFDVVNPAGGGVYTIQVTDPTRQAAVGLLKVGDSITVAVSPMVVNSIARCGLFGC